MPSDRQIAANRNNAKKSTGPRSEAGREASRRNARRHGLAIAIRPDPAFHDDIEKLARKIRAFLFETLSPTLSNLAEVNDKLAKLERYERRAFSRRNRALREM